MQPVKRFNSEDEAVPPTNQLIRVDILLPGDGGFHLLTTNMTFHSRCFSPAGGGRSHQTDPINDEHDGTVGDMMGA